MIESVSSEAKRRAIYQDVLDAPDDVVAEVIDGELFTQPRPRLGHAVAASRLMMWFGRELRIEADDPEGWVVLTEPELHLGTEPDIVVPDLAAWQRRRLPQNDRDAAFLTVAPDWACEILSPSTAVKDRTLKLPLYGREGVGWTWLLDPQTRVLECYALEAGAWTLVGSYAENASVRAPPFSDVELELRQLWQR